MNHQDLYKLLATVQKNVRCPQCGKQYDFSLMQIKGIVDTIVFLELHCSDHLPLLATVTLGKNQLQNNTTDLAAKISTNDVIETYRFLKSFDGKFEELFNKEIKGKQTSKDKDE